MGHAEAFDAGRDNPGRRVVTPAGDLRDVERVNGKLGRQDVLQLLAHPLLLKPEIDGRINAPLQQVQVGHPFGGRLVGGIGNEKDEGFSLVLVEGIETFGLEQHLGRGFGQGRLATPALADQRVNGQQPKQDDH